MRNEITEKVEIFLQNLRCENSNRETLVHLDSCRTESVKLEKMREHYLRVVDRLKMDDKIILEEYIEQIQTLAFAEQQEAYVQGILDAVQILYGFGILSSSDNVEKIIADIKNSSP